jgi:hypothetical protein
MKNITFTADEYTIAQARGLAQMRGTTLNEEFRVWIGLYIASHDNELKRAQTRSLIDQLTTATQSSTTSLHAYSSVAERASLRSKFNERELRMLSRLDGVSSEEKAAK